MDDKIQNLHFVIGGHKCGTTWLSQMHSQNTSIDIPLNKEPHFFSHRLDKGISWYKANWPNSDSALMKMDYSTHYYINWNIIDEVYKKISNPKFIFIIRDPVNRLISDFLHKKRDKSQIQTSLNSLLEEYPEMFELCLMGKYLSFWKDKIPKSDLLVLDFSQISSNPQCFLNNIDNFLDLPPFEYKNTKKKIGEGYIPRYRFLEILKNYAFYIISFFPGGINLARNLNFDTIYRKINSKSQKKMVLEIDKHHLNQFITDLELIKCFLVDNSYSDAKKILDQLEKNQFIKHRGVELIVK